jgi:hypothetical protein
MSRRNDNLLERWRRRWRLLVGMTGYDLAAVKKICGATEARKNKQIRLLAPSKEEKEQDVGKKL